MSIGYVNFVVNLSILGDILSFKVLMCGKSKDYLSCHNAYEKII